MEGMKKCIYRKETISFPMEDGEVSMEKQGASREEQAPPRRAATGAWTEVPKPGKKEYKTFSQESAPGHAMPEELERVPPAPG